MCILTLDTYVCVSGGWKCSFFGKFGVLCFLKTPVSRFALCLTTDEHQHTKTTEDEKVYIFNKCSYSNWKQSNQDWNTPIHLKNNDPHIKVPLIFWFFIMTFNLFFYQQLWVKWVCIHIENRSGHIRNVCGCLTLN